MSALKIRRRIVFAFHLNGALSTGKYDHISTDRVGREIAAETIFEFLERELGDDAGLNELAGRDRTELLDEWQRIKNATLASDLLVSKRGLALLVAYLLEGIKMKTEVGQ